MGGERIADAKLADVPVRGFHVVVTAREGSDVEGELLAAEAESVYVLDDDDGTIVATRWNNIDEVRVSIASHRPGEPATSIVWTTVGTVSTLSHGVFLFVTAGAWLGAGIPVSVANGRSIRGRVTADEFRELLYQFARYPQGMPQR
jgi:hypothetical protein